MIKMKLWNRNLPQKIFITLDKKKYFWQLDWLIMVFYIHKYIHIMLRKYNDKFRFQNNQNKDQQICISDMGSFNNNQVPLGKISPFYACIATKIMRRKCNPNKKKSYYCIDFHLYFKFCLYLFYSRLCSRSII